MRTSFFAGILLVAGIAGAQSPLTTSFTGTNQGNTGGALFFDLTVNTTVTITRFDVNCGTNVAANTPGSLTVHLGPPTYVGNTANVGAWTSVATGTLNTAAMGTPAPCTLASPFALGPGTYGVALVSSAFNFAYTTGALTVSNTELGFVGGAAQNVPWSTTVFTPRSANISIHYTPGGNPIQVASQQPYGAGCYKFNRTFYEWFPNTALGFDLGNRSMLLRLNTSGGYDVGPGSGNWFTPTSANLALGDDATVTQSLPFPLLYPAQGTFLTTLQLELCTNGFVSPAASNGNSSAPTVGAWLSGAARWGNWYDFDPSSVGSMHWDVDPSNTAAYVTWLAVPTAFKGTANTAYPAADLSTMQIAFFVNGDVEFRWQAMSLVYGGTKPTLVGWTPGGSTIDPGSKDLLVASTIQSFATQSVDNAPLALDVTGRPVINTSFNWVTSNITPGTAVGATLFGFQKLTPAVNLGIIGAPDCFQHLNFFSNSVFLVSGTTATIPWAIPNNNALNGVALFGQSLTFTPGFNPLGVLTSNGVQLVVGSL